MCYSRDICPPRNRSPSTCDVIPERPSFCVTPFITHPLTKNLTLWISTRFQFGCVHRRRSSSGYWNLEAEAGEVDRGGDPHRRDHSSQDHVRKRDEPTQEGSRSGIAITKSFVLIYLDRWYAYCMCSQCLLKTSYLLDGKSSQGRGSEWAGWCSDPPFL